MPVGHDYSPAADIETCTVVGAGTPSGANQALQLDYRQAQLADKGLIQQPVGLPQKIAGRPGENLKPAAEHCGRKGHNQN